MEWPEIDWSTLYSDYWYILKIILIILGAIVANYILRTVVSGYFRRESARINVDPTAYNFLKNATTFIIIIVASLSIVYSIPAFKNLALGLFAGAGILAAIIGFASQTAFSNIINGIMIVAFKPFRIGDLIEIGNREDYVGVVEDITLRHTVIRNYENKRVIIPNTVMSTEMIVNRSIVDEKTMRYLDVEIAYTANIDTAISILQEEALKHPLLIDNRTDEEIRENDPIVPVRVVNLGPSSVKLRGYIWAKNSAGSFELKTDVLKNIKERFEKEGIDFPYPQYNIQFVNKPDIKGGPDGRE